VSAYLEKAPTAQLTRINAADRLFSVPLTRITSQHIRGNGRVARKSGPVRVVAGWGRCRVTAGVRYALRVFGVGQWGRAARHAGALWDANPLTSLALGS